MEYELVYSLPDSYAKPVRYRELQFPTNTWRLFALTEEQMQQFQEDVQAQQRQLDLEQCKGAALDALGQMYSCIRSAGESDDRYRMALLCRIGSCFGDGTADSVLTAVSNFCGCAPGTLYFREVGTASVQLHVASAAVLQRLPVSLSELREMIGSLLAVGVGLEQAALVDNSFCYCAAGEEQSAAYDGTGYGESGAGLGGVILMEE